MYALIYNNQIVVGPRDWNYNMFKQWFDDNGVSMDGFPRQNPNSSIISSSWKLLPVTITEPSYDSLLFQLAGPYLSINDTDVTGHFNVVEKPLDSIRNVIKEMVTNNRYLVEIIGKTVKLSDNSEVMAYTSRGDRTMYLDALTLSTDESIYNFKFMDGKFKSVNKSDLQLIVAAVSSHVQMSFDWESSKHHELDLCTTPSQLVAVDIEHELLKEVF